MLLRNVHLCPSWLVTLEKKLHRLKPNAAFRLFLTSEIHTGLPVRVVSLSGVVVCALWRWHCCDDFLVLQVNLLRLSTVLVQQPPSGVKASLQRSLAAVPESRANARPAERGRLYFLVAWLHAVIQVPRTANAAQLRVSFCFLCSHANLAGLLCLLCLFQERLRYVPAGWTSPYEFSEADLTVALDAVDTWLVRRPTRYTI